MAEKKGKGKAERKPKAKARGKKQKPGHRLLTPQEIIEYYRKHKELPP